MLELFIVGLIIVAGFGTLRATVKRVFKPVDRLINAADEAAKVVETQTKIWSEAKLRELNKNRSTD